MKKLSALLLCLLLAGVWVNSITPEFDWITDAYIQQSWHGVYRNTKRNEDGYDYVRIDGTRLTLLRSNGYSSVYENPVININENGTRILVEAKDTNNRKSFTRYELRKNYDDLVTMIRVYGNPKDWFGDVSREQMGVFARVLIHELGNP
jgi:hypothetical protein